MGVDTLSWIMPPIITGIIGIIGGIIGGYIIFRVQQERRLVNLERDVADLETIKNIVKKVGTDQVENTFKKRGQP
jgi:hypothetical protein